MKATGTIHDLQKQIEEITELLRTIPEVIITEETVRITIEVHQELALLAEEEVHLLILIQAEVAVLLTLIQAAAAQAEEAVHLLTLTQAEAVALAEEVVALLLIQAQAEAAVLLTLLLAEVAVAVLIQLLQDQEDLHQEDPLQEAEEGGINPPLFCTFEFSGLQKLIFVPRPNSYKFFLPKETISFHNAINISNYII
jgi:hypothetical protein